MGFKDMQMGRHKGKSGKNAYPLRKIIKEEVDNLGLPIETLECGHKIRPPKDFIGYTQAVKRHCKYCYNELNKNEAQK